MTKKEIQEIIKRINEEPSVLFLGQSYLTNDSHDDYIRKVKETLQITDENIHDFSTLYSLIEKRCSDTKEIPKAMQKLAGVMQSTSASYIKVPWLKRLLSWRWNLVYTSAVDGIIYQNYSADKIRDQKASYRTEFAQKNRPHLVELFGSCDDDVASFPISSKSVHRQNMTRFDYIRNQIINQYGILIIDGWKASDWMNAETLIGTLLSLNSKSVYIFGISRSELLEAIKNPDDREDLALELDNECISVFESPFISVLQENGFLDNSEEQEEESLTAYSSYSLTFHDNQKVQITKKVLRELDNRIQLIHDDLVPLVQTDNTNTEIAFTTFLTQGTELKWALYSDKYAFYFKRDIDDALIKDIQKQLERKSNKRRPIILEGVSNSGKTTTLMHLALQLKHVLNKPAAVFYISGNPEDKEWRETLHALIRNHILNKQVQNHLYLSDVILICDMNIRDYTELQNTFAECNVLVIGSSYLRHEPEGQHIHLLNVELSDAETNELKRVLNAVNPKRCREFFHIIEYNKTKSDKYTPCIFELLEDYARFIGNRTWHEVTNNHRSRLARESNYTEEETGKAFFETRDFFLENGIGAALVQSIHREFGEDSKYEEYVKQIQKINKYVAMAGQFGNYLPFSLLLKMLSNGKHFTEYQIKVRFIRDVLALDSLLEFHVEQNTGWINVRFRNPKEAYQYLCYQQEDEEKRKKFEIELLCELIETCDWNEYYGDEAQKIISLIRSYGPNSLGRPFENYYERMPLKEYKEYIEYWHRIVSALENVDAISANSEALLVYCHFLREDASKKIDSDKGNDLFKKVSDANQLLSDYIETHKNQICNDYQMSRLEGEMCSNLNFLMKNTDYQKRPSDFDNDFKEFRKHFNCALQSHLKSRRGYTSGNLYLDMWLNAVQNYKMNKKVDNDSASDKDKEYYRVLMSYSLEYIERLFAPDKQEMNYTSLLEKIKKVFDYFKYNRMQRIEQQLDQVENDSMIYLNMMEPFLENFSDEFLTNQVTVFLDELAGRYMNEKALDKNKKSAVEAAKKSVQIFENNGYAKKAKKYQSYRCFYLYLKAKWLTYTGYLLLEEKQLPKLSQEQWREVKEICDEYLACFDNGYSDSLIKPSVLLLYACYNWMFCSNIDYTTCIQLPFERCSALMRSDSVVARIGMCDEKGELYTFAADIDVDGKPTASIRKKAHEKNDVLPADRRRIYISVSNCNQIFNGHSPRRLTADERPLVNIWFNGKGAQIGLVKEGKNNGNYA